MPEQSGRPVYEFGRWELDLARFELRADGVRVPMGSRALQIFAVMVESAGKLVGKDELMSRVWPNVVVEENTLEVHISAVRKALGPDRGMLRTAFGRGYRLVADWTLRKENTADSGALDPRRIPFQAYQTNAPAAASAVIGRTADARQLRELLSAQRAVTLTGPGGIGKTTLALEVARGLFPSLNGDCWFVDMAPQADPVLVPSMVASALGLKLGGEEISAESVARTIGGERLLLVLDNCEHVIDAAARLAESIIRLCPAASIMATSREALGIEGEHVYRVPPLDVPGTHQQESGIVLASSAVQLFVARMRALDSVLSPEGANLHAIAAICRRLDGIPLAIEFAAARAAVLGPELVLSRLDERFGLLTGGRRTALPRHQTLRATLDWSYELLSEPERCLLRRLGIFAAGFTLEAANTVMGNIGPSAPIVLEGIANLVAKSLVALDGSAPGGVWRLLETTRQYALEKLAESGETNKIARRCAEYLRDLLRPAIHAPQGPPTVEAMARYGREIDNVRAALDWSFSAVGDAEIGIALTAAYAPVWIDLLLVVECRDRIERALVCLDGNSDENPALTMQLHVSLAISLAYTMGSNERTRVLMTKALEAAERLADEGAAKLETLFVLWFVYHHSGECRQAQSIAERCERLADRTGSAALTAIADRVMGNTLHYAGHQREAQRCFVRMLETCAAHQYRRHTIWFRYDLRLMARAALARVLWLRGFVDQAVTESKASLDGAQAADHEPTLCWVLHYGTYPVALMRGDLDTAGRAVANLKDLAAGLGAPFWRTLARCLEGELLIKRGEFATGVVLLRSALNNCEKTGWRICYPQFLGALAEGLAGLGHFAEALDTVDRALAAADRGGERWMVAELLRMRGEFLIHDADSQFHAAAERCFLEAMEIAREQSALSWELRIAVSLARLRVRQHRHDHGRLLLTPVYDRFTEGFETPDLRAASAILQSFTPRAVKFAR